MMLERRVENLEHRIIPEEAIIIIETEDGEKPVSFAEFKEIIEHSRYMPHVVRFENLNFDVLDYYIAQIELKEEVV